MQTIKRDIYVTKNVLQAPIEVTEGTNSIAIEFDVRDYDIPASAAAVAYSLSTSSMEEPNKALADVSGNKITIIPSEAFFLPGQNVMQIRIIDGNSKLISFNIIVKCTGKMRFGDEKEEQQSTLVEQMLAKLGEYQKKSASPYNFKGSCLSSELPASGNTINDTYYCTDLKYRKTWNGSAWEQSSLNEADYEDELTKTNGEVSSLKEDIDDFVKDIVPLYINVIKNSYVNSTGIHEYEGWSRTDYIELEKYKYGANCLMFDKLSKYTRNCLFFDENNSIVSAFSVDTSTEKGLVHIPINAHKMIVSAEDEALKTIALKNPKNINGFGIDEYKQITSIIGDEIYPNINYINKGYISYSDGEVISDEYWSYTDYIDVHNAKSLNFISTLGGNRACNAIYTKGKKFIRGFDTSKPLDLSNIDGAYYVRLSNPTAYHFIVEKVFDNIVSITNNNKIPSYYNNYLKEKNKKVNEIMDNIKECTSFVFFTDVHVNNNSLNSPYIIKNILENTSVNDVICGGDIISGYNDENGIVKDCEIYLNKFGFSKPYFVRGNHDCYAKITEESTEGYIKDNKFVINRLMRKMPNDISIENGKTYYTFDRAQSKTRFIVIDTNENIHSTTDSGSWQPWYDISQEQINWFINELKNIPNGYKAIVCGHVPCVENIKWGSYFAYPFGDIIEAYNNKTTLNKHYDFGVNVDADFTNTSAKVCLYICGHGHTDDYYKSSSGCVYAELNCDAYLNNGGSQYIHEIGTITEQCVTVVMVNEDGYVQTVRYGVGIDQNYG